MGFAKMNCHKVRTGILVIGDTGCGKSTMLNAMLHGSHSLEFKITEEEKEIRGRNG